MFLHCRTSLDRLSAQEVGPERWGCPICAARPGGWGGARPRIGRPYRRDPGTRRHPRCPGTAAHPGTTAGSLTLRGTGRVPARRSWWRLPAGVVDELGHAVRSATHHAGGSIPVLGCDTPVSPPTAAS